MADKANSKKRSPGELNRFIADAMEFTVLGKKKPAKKPTARKK